MLVPQELHTKTLAPLGVCKDRPHDGHFTDTLFHWVDACWETCSVVRCIS